MTHTHISLVLPILMFGAIALADDTYQVHFVENLNVGDAHVNITNTGANSALSGSAIPPNICVNVYAYDQAEELISCCGCLITPNGLQALSVQKSLISNALTPASPPTVVIKLVASKGGPCDASSVTPADLRHGLLAWNTSLQQNTSTRSPTYGVVQTAFSFADLTALELESMTSIYGYIQANGGNLWRLQRL